MLARAVNTCTSFRAYSGSHDVPKRANVTGMKSDVERGPFGAWAYRTRERLDPLSVEQVAAALDYSAPTLRKVEGGSAQPSRRIRRDLPAYYARIAQERGIHIEQAPGADEPAPAADLAALIASTERVAAATAAFTEAVDYQTQKLDRVWDRLGDLIERLDRQQPLTKDDAQAMAEGLADGIGASLAGAITDLAAALRQPSPSTRGERG